MAVHRSRLNEAGDPDKLLTALGEECPALGERLAYRSGTEPIDAIANVPYGWRVREGRAGLFRLGDQAGVIPSLAGEGMGIALASGVSAAATFARGGADASADWQVRFAHQIELPIGVARTIAALGERRASAGALVAVARLAPSLVDLAARLTRVAR